jgi:hypothetical protein
MKTRPLLGRTKLYCDGTGVGLALRDSFHRAGISSTFVAIHGGQSVTTSPSGMTGIPKADLIGGLQIALEQKRFRVPASLAHASTLVSELHAFRVKPTASRNLTWAAASGQHDDLVLAAALAAYNVFGKKRAGRGAIEQWPGMP